ncbi:amidohydrolase [Rubrobacter xylanophilus DSM 9941]|uniref:Amidohydrolase n=1 Tax=Rubrobacter xylanophilus (strain DSM 9941 / JCM 11954 / NBRC 16129 / PRD-1) TaxID=266117 RepID=Q1AUL0_RUBXD|nr:amidohydrolase family protein [Rubrobacter xylanophilus]ABG04918.1 amidohydrolase [Rubrobacter xylanophilus DSM 9941]
MEGARGEILASRVLFPVTAPLLREGGVLVRDGRILAVGRLEELRREHPGLPVRHFGERAIVPGAVNVHAHLGFRRKDRPEGGSFSRWLARLIERLPEKEAWTAEAARDSAREAIEAGTTFMAESSPYGECLPQLAASGLAGFVFAEFFPHEIGGGTPEEAVEHIVGRVRELRGGLPERVEAHVSVHAPYTVDPESSRLAARRVRELGWRLAIHLSESPEEVEFVRDGTGGLKDIFARNDWGGVGLSPVRYAERVELLGPETIAAHLATGVSEEDVAVLARTGVAAAHCPRSNEYLGCGVSPVPLMLASGVRVGMGTDGLWSSPSMNLFEETLAAVRLHGFDGETGLRLATHGGARALGLEGEVGSLEAGKWADLAVVDASPGAGPDPAREVLEAAAGGGVVATAVGGRFLHDRSGA